MANIEYTEEHVDMTWLIILHTVMCHQIIITDRASIYNSQANNSYHLNQAKTSRSQTIVSEGYGF